MKVSLIAAITADGFIEREGEKGAEWTSRSDKRFFKEITKRAGIIVMGSKTYASIGRALPDRHTIVLSRSQRFEGVETTAESPVELVRRLEKEGAPELVVCGGSSVYTSFMKAGLVDTLYLTLEPVVFGKGIPLFAEAVDLNLELREARPIGDGAVVLEYSVAKSS
ncbi:MAG TPA: dihydrofolate reductase family protein [Candidatus Paceibacterota bacterium]|jgi:dihydrofolate reductase|nr:dihydrofolate reductase family protein [Candidatus Paceibacterota bacterium]